MVQARALRFRWLISLAGVLTLLQQHSQHKVYFGDSFPLSTRYQPCNHPHRHRFYDAASRSLPSFDHHQHLLVLYEPSNVVPSVFSSAVRRRLYSNKGNYDDIHNENDEDYQSINYNTTISNSSIQNNKYHNITVYRNPKKKSSTTMKEYKIVDNRDALPFQIQLHTPPDYHTTILRSSDAVPTVDGSSTSTTTITSQPSPTKSSTTNNAQKKKTSDTITTTPTLLSSVYRSNEENDLDNNNNKKKSHKKRKTSGHGDTETDSTLLLQKLGDYVLDASTTTGDTIVLQDNTVYRVIRHRCLYQYKQKQFVMCRKILEVKELNRYLSEQYIAKQFNL